MLLYFTVLERHPLASRTTGTSGTAAAALSSRPYVSMLLQFHGARKHGGKIKALLKRSFVLTKPLILGIGASKVLPIIMIIMIIMIIVVTLL